MRFFSPKACLLSVSSPHAASWLSVVPSENLGLHMDPPVFQVAIKWWLGLDTSKGSQCALCPGSALDHLGHHAVTCKYGGDVVSRHNRIRDILVETCSRAHIGVKVEVGNNLSRDPSKTRPADILLPNWFLGRTAALDVSITSPLNSVTLLEAGVLATAAAQATEYRKHQANDAKCSDLGWVCVPMVVETYGAWGKKATTIISSVASRLATSTCQPKSIVLNEIYGRLNLNLVCANATAVLSRIASSAIDLTFTYNVFIVLCKFSIVYTPYSTPTKSKSQQQPPHTHTLQPPFSECRNLARESKALALALTSERLSLWYKMVVACDLLHPIWMAR